MVGIGIAVRELVMYSIKTGILNFKKNILAKTDPLL